MTGRSITGPACLSVVLPLLEDKLFVNEINFNYTVIFLQFIDLKSIASNNINFCNFETDCTACSRERSLLERHPF
ncbi:MAG: hypothetical protein RJA20_1634 [Bacteroidota bacterium]